MIVTAIVGSVFTITRGAENTVDAAHASGASVFAPLTAGGLSRVPALMSELIGSSITYASDTVLGRTSLGTLKLSSSANTSLLLGNGGNAESGAIYWNGNNFVIGTQGAAGAGTARDVILGSAVGATNGVYLATEGTSRWNISSGGHLRPVATASYDLGTATEVLRSAYLAKLGTLTSNGLVTTSAGDGTLGITALGSNVAAWLSTPSSANLRAALTDETGTGAAVFADTPTLIAPLLGTPTSGVLTNCTGLPVGSVTGLGTGVGTWLATPSSANLLAAITDETGSGLAVFNNTPTLIAPLLGTPTSGVLTNCTGLPVGSVTGLGTGVGTFLATPSSANLLAAVTDETGTGALVFANTPTLVSPILGTPTSGTLTSCTGLPISTGVSGLGTNVATFLATPTSANLAAALTDETGTGACVFANTPTLVTPVLGVASGTSLALTSFLSSTQTLAAVSTDGLLLANTTAAAAGAQQWSPRVHWQGQGWKTTATAASQTCDFIAEIQPVQETTATQNRLVFSAQTAGAGYQPVLQVVVDAVNVPGSGDQVVMWASSGGVRGLWANTLVAGVNPGTGLTPSTDGGCLLKATGLFLRGDTALVTWTSGTDPNTGSDTILRRGGAAATVQLGSDTSSGAAVAQTLQAANATGSDHAGGNFTINSGKGSGAGAVSSVFIGTPTVLGSGSTAQSITTRLTLDSAFATFAVPIKLSNAATTGLVAGVLAASTNASIVLVDSGGQAYRIPCVI